MNQPPNTPLNADDELDNLLGPCLAFILGPDDESCLHCERVEAVLADRKKHELQARIDEQGRTLIGKTDPSPEIWVQLDGVGHPSSTQFERMRELKQELEKL